AAAKLAALGITTLDELRDHWVYGNRELINHYLGESPLRLISASPAAMLATRSGTGGPSPVVNLLDAGRTRPLVKHARGVALKAAQRNPATAPQVRAVATRTAAAATRPSVNLISKFPPVRNQQERGTCVAFSSIAFLEFHLAEQSDK